jgi:hypothetical protein
MLSTSVVSATVTHESHLLYLLHGVNSGPTFFMSTAGLTARALIFVTARRNPQGIELNFVRSSIVYDVDLST